MKKILLLLAVVVSFAYNGMAQVGMEAAEAKFIYNFTRFFDWPANEKSGDFVIGVIGSNTVYTELLTVTSGKRVVIQNIVVKKFKNPEDVTKCHVLFVGANKATKIGIIKVNSGGNTLIISDGGNCIKNGAAIRFYLSNERLKYEFSKTNISKTQLKYHSKVEELASKTY